MTNKNDANLQKNSAIIKFDKLKTSVRNRIASGKNGKSIVYMKPEKEHI